MLYIDKEQNIKLTRGDTGIFTISLTDSDGNSYTPKEGDSLRFAMAKNYGSEALINKQIPIDTCTLEIEPNDTKELNFGKYVYDIEFTDADGHVSTIILANFEVTREVY